MTGDDRLIGNQGVCTLVLIFVASHVVSVGHSVSLQPRKDELDD